MDYAQPTHLVLWRPLLGACDILRGCKMSKNSSLTVMNKIVGRELWANSTQCIWESFHKRAYVCMLRFEGDFKLAEMDRGIPSRENITSRSGEWQEYKVDMRLGEWKGQGLKPDWEELRVLGQGSETWGASQERRDKMRWERQGGKVLRRETMWRIDGRDQQDDEWHRNEK